MRSELISTKREHILGVARATYAAGSDDDIEIDDTAKIEPAGDEGLWVQAWVYLRVEDVSEET